MEIIEYKIKKGDTLESIAKEHNISVDELVDFHNLYAGITQKIVGNNIPFHLNFIVINKVLLKKQEKRKIRDGEKPNFDKKARYRCEQINTTTINGDLTQFVEQKFQYLIKIDTNSNISHVEREDYLKKISPPVMLNVLDFIEETDKIKHNILFTLDENGKLEKILNRKELNKNWVKYKKEKFYYNNFIIDLNNTNENAVQEIVNLGNIQFSLNADNEEEYRKDFFYFLCFNQYLVRDDLKLEEFKFLSTIVPPNIIPLVLRYDKILEENELLTIRMVGEYNLSEGLEKDIINQYNNLHKPSVGYNYTQYKLFFRAKIEIDTKTRLVKKANIKLRESIVDNVENECIYTIKQLENYKPDEGV